MRTLSEVLEAVNTDQPVADEELRYSLLAVFALAHFDSQFLLRFAGEKPVPAWRSTMEANESFRRWKTGLAADPKVYVGWGNDPKNPEYQRRRNIALKLYDKALKGELPNQKEKK